MPGEMVELVVERRGSGLAETTSLFVPFYTTKPGSGIGLALARQIAEATGVRFNWKTEPTGAGAGPDSGYRLGEGAERHFPQRRK